MKSVRKTKKIIVLEDHQQNGGLGEAIAILILKAGIKCNFRHLAVHDRFGQSGNPEELYNFYGLHLDRL